MKIKKIFIPNIRTAKIDPVSPKARIAAIKSAIDTYLLNTNQYPVTLNDLITDSGLEGWCGPYLKPSQLNDPWGRLYIYNVNGGSYILKSYGKDGKPGGKGDSADTFNY